MPKPYLCLGLLALVATSSRPLTTWAAPEGKAALEEARCHLTGISVRAVGEARQLRLRLDHPPSYTAFRLTDPSRLVVDINHADTSAFPGPLPLRDPLITDVAVYQYLGNQAPVGRVIFSLPETANYQVTTEGQDIVITARADQASDPKAPVVTPPSTEAPASHAAATPPASSVAPKVEAKPEISAKPEEHPVAKAPETPTPSPVVAPQKTSRRSSRSRKARIVAIEQRGEQILIVMRGKPDVQTTWLDNPSRLVVDLAPATSKKGVLRLKTKPAFVKQVRVGHEHGRIRLVFDLAQDKRAEALMQPEGLVIQELAAVGGVKASQLIQPTRQEGAATYTRRVQGFRADETGHLPDAVEPSIDLGSAASSVEPGAAPPHASSSSAGGIDVAPEKADNGHGDPVQGDGEDAPPQATDLSQYALRRAMGRPLAAESPKRNVQPPHSTVPPPSRRRGLAGRFLERDDKSALHRRRVSLDVKDADIINVLRLISEETGENIIASDEVHGKVTLKLRNVPADQALDTMLRTKGFDRVRHNNIIRIASAEAIQKERDVELARRRSLIEVEDTIIKMVTVNYATASEVVAQLRGMLSTRGSVQVDARTNTLVLQDIVSNIDRLVELAQRLDKQTPLVNIQARIVEASSDHVRDLGIQWGGSSQNMSKTGNPTGVSFPHDMVVNGGADAGTTNQTQGVVTPSRYAVNLPANLGGAGGSLGFILGSAGGSQLLDLRLSAAETNGTAKIISSPEVSTLDNRMAKVSQGTDIPISTVSAAGTMTRFIPAQLALEVTPHVTNDGTVLLKINVQKSQPDFSNRGAAGDPTIQRKQAETEVLVRDGDTSVIGGIYTRTTSDASNEIPFLGRIPLIGLLFREKRVADNRSELLVFITPRIINRDESLVQSGRILEGIKG